MHFNRDTDFGVTIGCEGFRSEAHELFGVDDEHDGATYGHFHRLTGEHALKRVNGRTSRHDLGALATGRVKDALDVFDFVIIYTDKHGGVALAQETSCRG